MKRTCTSHHSQIICTTTSRRKVSIYCISIWRGLTGISISQFLDQKCPLCRVLSKLYKTREVSEFQSSEPHCLLKVNKCLQYIVLEIPPKIRALFKTDRARQRNQNQSPFKGAAYSCWSLFTGRRFLAKEVRQNLNPQTFGWPSLFRLEQPVTTNNNITLIFSKKLIQQNEVSYSHQVVGDFSKEVKTSQLFTV